ncbi:sigma-70 family RNA polymerase sigma factor [Paenibacillus physcomitrellae]|uniref:RNA polymerase subunit sigma n=1 Tax=Paenibacillus physcomitrellae TaxID=1619311 RepID=A0ABQ1GNR1_9BACL|nr:sigma-70 family RNA polymerase sigma factor [Paenibacillus physcomitrellae]GGA47067.1 hypothetical protein GCM10010917_35400 [Paenibacillus physcomitrellae]
MQERSGRRPGSPASTDQTDGLKKEGSQKQEQQEWQENPERREQPVHLLVRQAAGGDRNAVEELVRRFSGMALAVAYDKLHDPYLAEDVVQDALTEALGSLRNLREPEAFPGWFKRMVERKCYRLLRSRTRQAGRVVSDEEVMRHQLALNGEGDPALVWEQRELRNSLYASIEGLAPGQRLAVRLFYLNGYSLSEISAFLGVSVAALKKRLFDARSRLKQSLPVADFIQVYSHLYERGTRMLHLVNGDHVAEKLKQGKVQGDILPWRELYTFGPVAPDMRNEELRKRRAAYLEQTLGIPEDLYIGQCEEQEAKLERAGQYDEIVLWFEHDLYDQTMLAYLLTELDRLGLCSGAGQVPVSLLCIGDFPGIEIFRGLGQLTPEQLTSLSGTWKRVGEAELELVRKFWDAYTSPDTRVHAAFLKEDLSALPFARAAFEAHLARIPSAFNGLGWIEQTVLELIGSGIHHPHELFRQAGLRLNVLGLGDLEFWYGLSRMCQGSQALLDIRGLSAFPDYRHTAPDFRDCTLEITSFGRQVLQGEQHAAELADAGLWVGGLYLEGKKSE